MYYTMSNIQNKLIIWNIKVAKLMDLIWRNPFQWKKNIPDFILGTTLNWFKCLQEGREELGECDGLLILKIR